MQSREELIVPTRGARWNSHRYMDAPGTRNNQGRQESKNGIWRQKDGSPLYGGENAVIPVLKQ